jgi:hypothetical protein
LRSIQANSFSRQIAMPGLSDGISVWRERKKLVFIMSNGSPPVVTRRSAAGTSVSSRNPKRSLSDRSHCRSPSRPPLAPST